MLTTDLSSLFELLPIGAYRLAPDGTILRVNVALVQLNGYAHEADMRAALGNVCPDPYLVPGRRQEFLDLLYQHGQVTNFESEMVRLNNGQTWWVREHAHVVFDDNNHMVYYEGTIEDITQERAAKALLHQREALLHNLLQTIPDRVWLKDMRGLYLTCNEAFASHLGARASDIVGTSDAHWLGPALAERFWATDRMALQAGKAVVLEEEMPSPIASLGTLYEVIKTPMYDAQGNAIGVLGMARDIQQRKNAEALLRDTTEQLELAIMGADLGRWDHDVTQAKGYYLDERACQLLGRDVNESKLGRAWGHLVHPDDLPATVHAMRAHLAGTTPTYEVDYRARHTDGRWIWLSSRGKVVQFGRDGTPQRMVGTLMDITERKSTEEAIQHLAFHDSLTGLPNRRLLTDRLQSALTASTRHGHHGALMFLDLDKFKLLNDTFGHDVGDLMLQEVARRLQQNVRAIDTVARLGGDEFVVLVQELSTDVDDALMHATIVGHKILASLNEPYTLGDHAHTSTPSIGATLFSGDAVTPVQILKNADTAMYKAKAQGRNTLCFDESHIDPNAARMRQQPLNL